MTGADVVQMVSVLLEHGIEHLALLQRELSSWLTEHEYTSLRQMRGSMNMAGCPNPKALERAHYMRVLQSRHGE
jgi:dihydroorotate dehydrogenase (fumarate)